MTAREQPLAILFVDVSGSTTLFEADGDDRALELIGACIDAMAEQVYAHRGEVIRSRGDDLLAVFPDCVQAFAATQAMMADPAVGQVTVHAGLHVGPVIRDRGDIFGDAVNLAARMLSLAKPGEMMATGAFVEELPGELRPALQGIGVQSVRGRQEPVGVYSMVFGAGQATRMHPDAAAPAADADGRVTLMTLRYQGREYRREEGGPDLLIGRSDRCDLRIENAGVSREHATLKVARARAVLTDHSSTGTHVSGMGAALITLRRESLHLVGSGRIRLGALSPDPDPSVTVEYRQSSLDEGGGPPRVVLGAPHARRRR